MSEDLIERIKANQTRVKNGRREEEDRIFALLEESRTCEDVARLREIADGIDLAHTRKVSFEADIRECDAILLEARTQAKKLKTKN